MWDLLFRQFLKRCILSSHPSYCAARDAAGSVILVKSHQSLPKYSSTSKFTTCQVCSEFPSVLWPLYFVFLTCHLSGHGTARCLTMHLDLNSMSNSRGSRCVPHSSAMAEIVITLCAEDVNVFELCEGFCR